MKPGLAKSLRAGRVVPILLDIEFADLPAPLRQFQGKRLAKGDLIEVLKSINQASGKRINDVELLRNFRVHWPGFTRKMNGIPKSAEINDVVKDDPHGWAEIVSKVDRLQATLQSIQSAVLPSSAKPAQAADDDGQKEPVKEAKDTLAIPPQPPPARHPLEPGARSHRSVETQSNDYKNDYKKVLESLTLASGGAEEDAARMLFSQKELTASARSASRHFLVYRPDWSPDGSQMDRRPTGIRKSQIRFFTSADNRSVHFTLKNRNDNGGVVQYKGSCFASKRVLYLLASLPDVPLGGRRLLSIALSGVTPTSRAFVGIVMSVRSNMAPVVGRVMLVRTKRRFGDGEIGRLSLAAAEIEAPTVVKRLFEPFVPDVAEH